MHNVLRLFVLVALAVAAACSPSLMPVMQANSIYISAGEIDQADRVAASYYLELRGAGERATLYNGKLYDITATSSRLKVRVDVLKVVSIAAMNRPMVYFHNHPLDSICMYPSPADFRHALETLAGLHALGHQPLISFRVMCPENGGMASVEYGMKRLHSIKIKWRMRLRNTFSQEIADLRTRTMLANTHVNFTRIIRTSFFVTEEWLR